LESRQRIGLYGSGEVPRSRKLWSRAPGPESLGLKDIRQLPPIRRVKPTNIRKKVLAASAIMVIAAVLVLAALALAPTAKLLQAEPKQGTPGTPYPVLGIAFDISGVPLGGVHLNITNTNTTMFNNTLVTETTPGSEGYYVFDLGSLGQAQPGHVITIVANTTTATGANITVLPLVFSGYIWFNVTLNGTAIPEFGAVVVPVVGVLAAFIMTVLVARVRNE